MYDVLSVVPLGHHGVVEEGDELQLGQAAQRLQVGKFLTLTMRLDNKN